MIATNLVTMFESTPDIASADYIILSGDTTDKLLTVASNPHLDGTNALIYIGKYCIRHGIKLRILEGTPSHDRKQIAAFALIVKELMPELDFLYITDITIVRESDCTVLYVPDEIRQTTSETLLEVKRIMSEMNIEKVDTAVMHGAFDHSMPFGKPEHTHIEAEYLALVRGYIIIGHIHGHKVFSRIITPGSFDRLAHGEEEDKGIIMTLTYKNPDQNSWVFIKNRAAKIFKTISVTQGTDEELIAHLAEFTRHYPDGAAIRLALPEGSPLIMSNEAERTFTRFVMTRIIMEDKKDLSEEQVAEMVEMVSDIVINESTIGGLLTDVMSVHGADDELRELALKWLHKG